MNGHENCGADSASTPQKPGEGAGPDLPRPIPAAQDAVGSSVAIRRVARL